MCARFVIIHVRLVPFTPCTFQLAQYAKIHPKTTKKNEEAHLQQLVEEPRLLSTQMDVAEVPVLLIRVRGIEEPFIGIYVEAGFARTQKKTQKKQNREREPERGNRHQLQLATGSLGPVCTYCR